MAEKSKKAHQRGRAENEVAPHLILTATKGVYMAKKLAYERFYWFHSEIKAGRHPNARKLAEEFEVSPKTAQLDIEFFRDRLAAPLEYSYKQKGYFYTDDSFELPAIWLNEREIIALTLARQLAASIPNRKLKDSLAKVLKTFFRHLSNKIGIEYEDIAEKISLKNVEYYGTDETLFEKVLTALFRGHPAEIVYYSPHLDQTSARKILPLHLLNYMGNWHLIAYCTQKKALRTFVLSRIQEYNPTDGRIPLPEDIPRLKDYIRENFGIFYGGESIEVALCFSPRVAGFVREQIWHKKQALEHKEDGRLVLRIPVSDLREIKREILKYGADVEVLAPAALREEIKAEIEKMGGIY